MISALISRIKTGTFTLVFDDFKQITKVGLSLSVVFSSLAGYLLGANTISYNILILLAFGGYCMVGASNAFNQVIERDLDALMKRTQNRPIPSGRMSVQTALIIAVVFTIVGIAALYIVNPKTAMFGGISIFLYTSVYTSIKNAYSFICVCGCLSWGYSFHVRLGCGHK